ncbi:tryptophan-rich sensory protein [Nakamurella leprariae]|uniref:Tryptophan-rich sensory protein n=1 Tax=Nakamurella leprariae TaxID=2803911 RepID=A0A938Y626_9ACTN|nr:tryptophan-rich sensory protein [Nakamurella leprariae]MBM9466440.1 tryptophan-rich sensory protein [Nakamurella leprariae]
MATTPTITALDRARLFTVTVSEVLCVLGTLLGVGVFGGPPVAEAAGGALAADATLLAPATQAFSIWTVIYLGLAAYTVWQWLPGQRTDTRHRRIGWLVAGSMLLNALWLLVVRGGLIWFSVLVIAGLVVLLGVLVQRVVTEPATGRVDTVLVDGMLGLYLGWVSVAVCANVTAALRTSAWDPTGGSAETLAVLVLAVVALVGVVVQVRTRNVAVALAMAWGLAWIAVGRLGAGPESTVTAVAAVATGVVVLGAAVVARRAGSRTPESGTAARTDMVGARHT